MIRAFLKLFSNSPENQFPILAKNPLARRALWLTDIHLNFVDPNPRRAFFTQIKSLRPGVLIISGDIGEGNSLIDYLSEMENYLQIPIYFVLGNHDFYRSSFERVEHDVTALCAKSKFLHFLDHSLPFKLSPSIVLLGHSSWYDVRFGSGDASRAQLADFRFIKEFHECSPIQLINLSRERAQRAADWIGKQLPEALKLGNDIYLVTHVPPVIEAVRYRETISDREHLPYYSSKVVGDILTEIMRKHPEHSLTVLCGHTHTMADVQVLPNFRVRVGAAEYEAPIVQDIIPMT